MVSFLAYMLSVALFLRYLSNMNTPPPIAPVRPPGILVPIAQRVEPSVGVPARLVIPSININTAVKSVGIAANGEMDIDDNPDEVAWYNLGPRPGVVGSAVIAGHYGWDKGKASVFNNLHVLKTGDSISVGDAEGATTFFVVREIRSYDPAADATVIFRSNDGKAHLNLITCEGTWSRSQQTYSKRLVVFADKV